MESTSKKISTIACSLYKRSLRKEALGTNKFEDLFPTGTVNFQDDRVISSLTYSNVHKRGSSGFVSANETVPGVRPWNFLGVMQIHIAVTQREGSVGGKRKREEKYYRDVILQR